MYRMLIADDEPKIRRGLKKLKWQDLDIEVVGEAANGMEVLEKLDSLEPDIMLLDINMPMMSGLELIKEMKKREKECLVIIISGYDEFEYAREALKHNVFDYILKPVDRKKLFETVGKGLQKLDKAQKQEKLMEWANTQVEDQQEIMVNNFFKKWLAGGLNDYQIHQNMDVLNLNLDEYNHMLLMRILPIKEMDAVTIKGNLLEFCITNIIDETLQAVEKKRCVSTEENTFVIFLHVDEMDSLLDMMQDIRKNMKAYLSIHVLIEDNPCEDASVSFVNLYNRGLEKIRKDSEHSPLVQLARAYVMEHYSDMDLSIEDVAKHARVSTSYLSKALRKELDCSYTELVQRIRIENAVRLMQDPMLRIYDISEKSDIRLSIISALLSRR